jgi:hypothetical protein
MIKILKNYNVSSPLAAAALLTLIIVILLQSCQREDMFDFATSKHPKIYAVTDTDDTLYTAIVRAGTEGYFDEVTTTISSGTALTMDVDNNENVYLFDGATSYIINDEGKVTTATVPIIVGAAASNSSGTFAFSISSRDVYRYSSSSASWLIYKTLNISPYYPELASVDIDENIVFFMYTSGGTVYIYDLETQTLQLPSYSMAPGTAWFERNNGSFYTCKTSSATSLYINGTYTSGIGSPVGTDYAAADDGSVFAAEKDSNLAVYIADGTTFTCVYRFSSTNGNMKLAGIRKGELAIGMSSTDMSEDGLYVFKYSSGTMKRLTSKPVYMLKVR